MNGRVLVRTSFLLIVLTAGVKLLGFARDQVVAFVFGAGPITDAFYIALTLPMVLVSMIGGTFSTAFVPVLTDLWQKDRAAGWRTMRSVGSGYLGIVIAVAAGVVVGAPLLTHVLGPGLPP
ncbi:MAG TPA: lipid II flippase MurJ, partial [bacterium]|nr:lipid II flippase MurJ [bacterium]